MWVIGSGMWNRGSECEAITDSRLEFPFGIVVAVVARPTEHLVRAVIAKEVNVIARPAREEIVTVTTCEHGFGKRCRAWQGPRVMTPQVA